MRILVLTDVLFPDTVGGAGRVAFHLSRELGRRGHEVVILTRNPGGSLPRAESLGSGLTVRRFRTPLRETPLLIPAEMARSWVLARRLSRETAFDLAVAHQCLPALGPEWLGCLKGVTVFYLFHSPWHEEYLVKKGRLRGPGAAERATAFLMKRMEKRAVQRATRVMVLSRYMAEQVTGVHLVPREKISIIPGGVDLTRFRVPLEGKAALKKAFGLPGDRTTFLTVRNLVPRMGIENLLEAFRRSPALRERGFLLIGGEGPLMRDLMALREHYRLEDSIRFQGHVPESDLPELYGAADFFVLPTRHLEGFGLVILEAMASGTPVLGTPVGAIPEIIRPFDPRLLFDGTGWEDLARKLEDILLCPELYRFDAKDCREYVEENYSWQMMAAAFEKEMAQWVRPCRRKPFP